MLMTRILLWEPVLVIMFSGMASYLSGEAWRACKLDSSVKEEDWPVGSPVLASPAILGLLAEFVFTTEAILFRAIPAS